MSKKIQFLLYALLFSGLFLTSCQKEKKNPKTTFSQAEANKMVEDSRKEDKIRIRHFLDKMATVMSGASVAGRDEPLTIEDMAFGTEAVLNIYYTKPDNRFTEVDKAESVVIVPISSAQVSDADLLTAYNEVGQKAMDHLDEATYPNKKLVYVDVVITNQTDTEASLAVKTAVGEKLNTATVLAPPYFDKGWRCGETVTNDAGEKQWGDYDYNETDKDAAKLYKSTLNEHFRLDNPLPDPGYYTWYTYDVSSNIPITLFDDEYPTRTPNDVLDNSQDFLFYKILKSTSANGVDNYEEKKYINMDEMNFYYSGLEAAILMIEDPVWQANNSNLGFDLELGHAFLGNKFLEVDDIIALETDENTEAAKTRHIPSFTFQRVWKITGYPGGDDGDPKDAIIAVDYMLTP